MKVFALFVLTLLGVSAQTPMEKLTDQVCVCFSRENTNIDELMGEKLSSCLKELPKAFQIEIVIALGIDTTEMDQESAYKFGHELGKNVVPLLVQRCDQFYYAVEKFKSNFFGSVDRQKEIENIKVVSKLIKQNPSPENYLSRAMSHYKLGKSKDALKDIERMIRDKNGSQGYLLRAFVYDQMGEYKKAMTDYQKCKELTQRVEFDVFRAIAARKLKEK